MTDLISREKAIHELRNALYKYEDENEEKYIKNNNTDEWFLHIRPAVQDMNDIDVQTIVELPSESPWHTGTPTVNDPFYIREVFILQFATPTGGWYFHGHLFKPDFSNKCFRSWVDKGITFAFDCPDLWWQKIEPYKENEE